MKVSRCINTLSEDAGNHDWVQEQAQPQGCTSQPGKNESSKAREAEPPVDGNRQTTFHTQQTRHLQPTESKAEQKYVVHNRDINIQNANTLADFLSQAKLSMISLSNRLILTSNSTFCFPLRIPKSRSTFPSGITSSLLLRDTLSYVLFCDAIQTSSCRLEVHFVRRPNKQQLI
ncbi:hypothetical protein DL98DRAFT_98218 [Cadophora sp. DSE1049]|nr:hypothetical protein DL98DRAFT_98218 [Cadophora sp. DSE1049]